MNYKVDTKTLYKIPNGAIDSPFQIISEDILVFYNYHKKEMNYISLKTKKYLKQSIKLGEPYFSILDDFKVILKLNEKKVSLFLLEKDLSNIKKLKDINIKEFSLAKSLSNGGYLLCCDDTMKIYNKKDQLEKSFESSSYVNINQYSTPFEINLAEKTKIKKHLLYLSINGDTLYEIDNLDNIKKNKSLIPKLNLNNALNDFIILNEDYIVLIDEDNLYLVNLNNYKIEYKAECPQPDDSLIYVYFFMSIFKYKENIFATFAGYRSHSDNFAIITFWRFNKQKKNVEIIQSSDCGFHYMLNKEKLLIIERDEDDNMVLSQVKIRETNKKVETVETTTISIFEKKNKKIKDK